eukprot:557897-Alexandrium_andersonii.AAC.1
MVDEDRIFVACLRSDTLHRSCLDLGRRSEPWRRRRQRAGRNGGGADRNTCRAGGQSVGLTGGRWRARWSAGRGRPGRRT